MDTQTSDTPISIDCNDCVMQGTDACDGCIVTFICDRESTDAVIIDAAEARAVRLLNRSGLVPPVRHQPATPARRRRVSCA